MKYARPLLAGLCLAAVVISSLPSWADNDGEHRGGAHNHKHRGYYRDHERDHDHDLALEALRKGEVMPLEQLLTLVRARFDGVVVHTRLKRDNDAWMYELKIVDRRGRLREIYVDAKTGKLLKIEHD